MRRPTLRLLRPLLPLLLLGAAGAADFHAELAALVDGRDEMPPSVRTRVMAAVQPPLSGLGGVSFGMTMQQVIDLWGRPNGVWFQLEDDIQLSIYHSSFLFRRNALVQVSLHAVDLPGLAVHGPIRLGAPLPDLAAAFPGATIEESGMSKVVTIGDTRRLRVLASADRVIAVDLVDLDR